MGDSLAHEFASDEHAGVVYDHRKARHSPGEEDAESQKWRARLKTIDPAIAAASNIVLSETLLRRCAWGRFAAWPVPLLCLWSSWQSGPHFEGEEDATVAAASAAAPAAVLRSILIE